MVTWEKMTVVKVERLTCPDSTEVSTGGAEPQRSEMVMVVTGEA